MLIESNLTGIAQFSKDWSKFPEYICSDNNKMNRDLFGIKVDQNFSDNHSVKTIIWDKIYRPKCEGGLCISKMEDLNAASLAKQG